MQAVAVLAAEQQLGLDAVLDHVRRAPLAGDQRVVAEVPPEVVGEVLRPRSISQRPSTSKVSWSSMKMPPGAIAVGRAERADVDAVRAAVDGVRPAVAGPLRQLLRLDGLDDLGLRGIGLGVDDVDARGAQARAR